MNLDVSQGSNAMKNLISSKPESTDSLAEGKYLYQS